MSQALKPQNTSDKNSENEVRKITVRGTIGLIVAGLIVLLIGLFAYDRVGGSWVQHTDQIVAPGTRESQEPGTLQYGGSNAFPRTDPIR